MSVAMKNGSVTRRVSLRTVAIGHVNVEFQVFLQRPSWSTSLKPRICVREGLSEQSLAAYKLYFAIIRPSSVGQYLDEATVWEWWNLWMGQKWVLEGWAHHRLGVFTHIFSSSLLQSAYSALRWSCMEMQVSPWGSCDYVVGYGDLTNHSTRWGIWSECLWGRKFRCYFLGVFTKCFFFRVSSSYHIQQVMLLPNFSPLQQHNWA